MMRNIFSCSVFAFSLTGTVCSAGAAAENEPASMVTIVVSESASPAELAGAEELIEALRGLYPRSKFSVASKTTETDCVVYLGTRKSLPRLSQTLNSGRLLDGDGYLVTTAEVDGRRSGVILGGSPRGTIYGIYGLLRRLGCGSYLSFDTRPKPKEQAFSFAGWQLADRPLVPVRMVFNWHNFLSGCSTWEIGHWRNWIIQSQKMGYNAMMVHAYGNNPMAGFRFDGVQKPVGYLSSTQVGRDWSTNHVQDVRRLWGGEAFDSPVFGCAAAVSGTDAERTVAAQRLMSAAFECADQRDMDVFFAVDIDTTTANPQGLIMRLPERARFRIDVEALGWMGQAAGTAWLANPETPEGFLFYKAQVAELLQVYPQIDCLVAWHRKHNTPWMGFSLESAPPEWRAEYQREIDKTPDASQLWHAPHMFAQAKVVRAFQRAVQELGRDDVRIAFGSWDFDFLPGAHRFMPPDVALIPLDWMVLRDASVFDAAERRQAVAAVAADRAVIPIAWAHHDDGNYVGRPYTPYQDFHDLLEEMRCESAGFGIIHWTTKPLDLYFASLINQVWATMENQPLDVTCRQMAEHLIGPQQSEAFASYLLAWVTTMPKIGRETSDRFIDHELPDLVGEQQAQQGRLKLLAAVDTSQVTVTGKAWVDFFAGLERYILEVYQTEAALRRAQQEFADGDLAAARLALSPCRPEQVIARYAQFSQLGGLSRGEAGLIVSMNLRWLPHYLRLRQQLGIEAIRYNFADTSHDPLAQSRGVFTYHFDAEHKVWQTLGREETGSEVVHPDSDGTGELDEILHAGIKISRPITLPVGPVMDYDLRRKPIGRATAIPAGGYQLELHWCRVSEAGCEVRVDIAVGGNHDQGFQLSDRRPAGGSRRRSDGGFRIELKSPASVAVTLTPLAGTPVLGGLTLKPVEE